MQGFAFRIYGILRSGTVYFFKGNAATPQTAPMMLNTTVSHARSISDRSFCSFRMAERNSALAASGADVHRVSPRPAILDKGRDWHLVAVSFGYQLCA
jgi:hypothetical protein